LRRDAPTLVEVRRAVCPLSDAKYAEFYQGATPAALDPALDQLATADKIVIGAGEYIPCTWRSENSEVV
jgi:hypothetical protein